MLALLFAIATALVVLIAYMVAELYLSAKGWMVVLPDGRELAHLRMRNLLLWVGVPLMAILGFVVGWLSHVPSGRDEGEATQPAMRGVDDATGSEDR